MQCAGYTGRADGTRCAGATASAPGTCLKRCTQGQSECSGRVTPAATSRSARPTPAAPDPSPAACSRHAGHRRRAARQARARPSPRTSTARCGRIGRTSGTGPDSDRHQRRSTGAPSTRSRTTSTCSRRSARPSRSSVVCSEASHALCDSTADVFAPARRPAAMRAVTPAPRTRRRTSSTPPAAAAPSPPPSRTPFVVLDGPPARHRPGMRPIGRPGAPGGRRGRRHAPTPTPMMPRAPAQRPPERLAAGAAPLRSARYRLYAVVGPAAAVGAPLTSNFSACRAGPSQCRPTARPGESSMKLRASMSRPSPRA
jgi:hypothetical protein